MTKIYNFFVFGQFLLWIFHFYLIGMLRIVNHVTLLVHIKKKNLNKVVLITKQVFFTFPPDSLVHITTYVTKTNKL